MDTKRIARAALAGLTTSTLLFLFSSVQIGTAYAAYAADTDVLAIGDIGGNDVKFFDAQSGKQLESPAVAAGSGELQGPMGVLYDAQKNRWIVANQIFGTTAGNVLQYDATGNFAGVLTPGVGNKTPWAPQGILLYRNNKGMGLLFVADAGDIDKRGQLLAYRVDGQQVTFVGNLDPGQNALDSTIQFHPRGIVIGPDGYLYASMMNFPFPSCGGSILRFDPEHLTFRDVLLSNSIDCTQNANDLHRPEGLVFSPNGDLYVTSFRKDPNDLDRILILPHSVLNARPVPLPLDRIDLYANGQPRAYAEALLFGPDGNLYVPITNTSEVRRYNVSTKAFWTFIPRSRALLQPWFLTFKKTNPATLSYTP